MRIIAGRWGGRTIRAPSGERTRPTTDRVREAWMSALQHDIPGATVLDLFAGSGALGLETLSRGAAHVTFVERAAAPLRALQQNVDALGAGDEVEVVKAEAVRWVETQASHAFDIALADPPYDTDDAQRLVTAWARVPFAHVLCIEHRTRTALDAVPDLAALATPPGIRTRRYGDTALTFITAAA